MKAFSKILVPVDFSQAASEAVRMGADLSTRYSAELCLLYVHEPVNYALPPGYPTYHSPEQLERLLVVGGEHLVTARKLAEAAGAQNVETHQLQGTPATEIVEFAKKRGFDLIVIGTHGRTGLTHALLGSVAEKVVRKAPCPVLAVRTTGSQT